LVVHFLDPVAAGYRGDGIPALRIPAFRRLVLRLLSDERVAGAVAVERLASGTPIVQVRARYGAPDELPRADLEPIVTDEQTLRVADFVAWRIARRYAWQARYGRQGPIADPPPAFSPVWTVERRDFSLAQFRTWLRGRRPPVEAPHTETASRR
ncbi:MAG: hypothetical protein WBC44_12860, partial [Planctomycetaceae bacterium]